MEDINAQICIGDDYELSENELYQIEQILTYRSIREEEADVEGLHSSIIMSDIDEINAYLDNL